MSFEDNTAAAAQTVNAGSPPTPGTGPLDDELVWLAVARSGVTVHRVAQIPPPAPVIAMTGCNRSTRTGLRLAYAEARRRHAVVTCPTCWPQPGAIPPAAYRRRAPRGR